MSVLLFCFCSISAYLSFIMNVENYNALATVYFNFILLDVLKLMSLK